MSHFNRNSHYSSGELSSLDLQEQPKQSLFYTAQQAAPPARNIQVLQTSTPQTKNKQLAETHLDNLNAHLEARKLANDLQNQIRHIDQQKISLEENLIQCAQLFFKQVPRELNNEPSLNPLKQEALNNIFSIDTLQNLILVRKTGQSPQRIRPTRSISPNSQSVSHLNLSFAQQQTQQYFNDGSFHDENAPAIFRLNLTEDQIQKTKYQQKPVTSSNQLNEGIAPLNKSAQMIIQQQYPDYLAESSINRLSDNVYTQSRIHKSKSNNSLLNHTKQNLPKIQICRGTLYKPKLILNFEHSNIAWDISIYSDDTARDIAHKMANQINKKNSKKIQKSAQQINQLESLIQRLMAVKLREQREQQLKSKQDQDNPMNYNMFLMLLNVQLEDHIELVPVYRHDSAYSIVHRMLHQLSQLQTNSESLKLKQKYGGLNNLVAQIQFYIQEYLESLEHTMHEVHARPDAHRPLHELVDLRRGDFLRDVYEKSTTQKIAEGRYFDQRDQVDRPFIYEKHAQIFVAFRSDVNTYRRLKNQPIFVLKIDSNREAQAQIEQFQKQNQALQSISSADALRLLKCYEIMQQKQRIFQQDAHEQFIKGIRQRSNTLGQQHQQHQFHDIQDSDILNSNKNLSDLQEEQSFLVEQEDIVPDVYYRAGDQNIKQKQQFSNAGYNTRQDYFQRQ